jgi:hypothetical protein
MRFKYTNNKNIYWRFEIDFFGMEKHQELQENQSGTRGASVIHA